MGNDNEIRGRGYNDSRDLSLHRSRELLFTRNYKSVISGIIEVLVVIVKNLVGEFESEFSFGIRIQTYCLQIIIDSESSFAIAEMFHSP